MLENSSTTHRLNGNLQTDLREHIGLSELGGRSTVSLAHALTTIGTIVAMVLAVSGVSLLGLWNAAGPILTYETPPGGLGFEWGTGPVSSHVDVRLRNQGWMAATNYAAEITVGGNITACHIRLGSSYDQLYDCANGFPSGVQPCGARNMFVISGQNSVDVLSGTFPAGCDITVGIDSIAPFPSVQVSGKADQAPIEKLGQAQQQITQRDFAFWVFVSLFAIVIVLVCVSVMRRKFTRMSITQAVFCETSLKASSRVSWCEIRSCLRL